jgi:[ribosomal protein S5]-alanine N-acetyltransferase
VTALPPLRASTARMEIRQLRESDAVEFERVVLVSRELWTPWMPTGATASGRDRFEKEVARARAGLEAGTHLRLAGFLEDGRMAGTFALNEIVRGVLQSAYAGWAVSSDVMGRGLGTEGVRALLELAFEAPPRGLGLHRMQANIIPANGASLRIAEKVGFRHEGLAKRYLKIAGVWQDHEMFAMTAEEWRRVG